MSHGRASGGRRELPPSFEAWWADKAQEMAAGCLRKAQEYGADDLYDMGADFIDMMQDDSPNRLNYADTDAYLAGVFWYVLGKVKRWQSALRRRQRPSKDTLEDIVVYAMMALHEMERFEVTPQVSRAYTIKDSQLRDGLSIGDAVRAQELPRKNTINITPLTPGEYDHTRRTDLEG